MLSAIVDSGNERMLDTLRVFDSHATIEQLTN